MAKVGITACSDYNNCESVIESIFNLHGGLDSFIQKGDRVLVKPNLLSAPKRDNEPITTDPALIYGMCHFLRVVGVEVSVGDSPAFGTVESILKKIGIYHKLKELGVEVIQFNRGEDKFKKNTLDIALSEHNKLINLPKLKVHKQLLVTLCVKNLFGCVTGKRKALLHVVHGDKKNFFAEMLVQNYQIINPTFTILDGVVAMTKNGPMGGYSKPVGYLFSGVDNVAIDRVVIEALNIPMKEYRILVAAKELGVGETDIHQIEITGAKRIPSISLEYPNLMGISFSPIQVVRSSIKNFFIKRKKTT